MHTIVRFLLCIDYFASTNAKVQVEATSLETNSYCQIFLGNSPLTLGLHSNSKTATLCSSDRLTVLTISVGLVMGTESLSSLH